MSSPRIVVRHELAARMVRLVALALACTTVVGCGATDVIAEVTRDGSTAESGAPSTPPASDELGAWCRGEGGLWITHRDGVRSLECANRLAASSFPRAVCACNSLLGPGTLSTALIGPDGALQSTGASIAANGAGAPLVAPGA